MHVLSFWCCTIFALRLSHCISWIIERRNTYEICETGRRNLLQKRQKSRIRFPCAEWTVPSLGTASLATLSSRSSWAANSLCKCTCGPLCTARPKLCTISTNVDLAAVEFDLAAVDKFWFGRCWIKVSSCFHVFMLSVEKLYPFVGKFIPLAGKLISLVWKFIPLWGSLHPLWGYLYPLLPIMSSILIIACYWLSNLQMIRG